MLYHRSDKPIDKVVYHKTYKAKGKAVKGPNRKTLDAHEDQSNSGSPPKRMDQLQAYTMLNSRSTCTTPCNNLQLTKDQNPGFDHDLDRLLTSILRDGRS